MPEPRKSSRLLYALVALCVVGGGVGAIASWQRSQVKPERPVREIAAPQRMQIPGTRISLVPAPGLTGMPGASMLTGRNNTMIVMTQQLGRGELDSAVAELGSPTTQKSLGLSDVRIELRPAGELRRAFIRSIGTEQVGVFRKYFLLIDDGRHGASLTVVVPKRSYDTDPGLDALVDRMFESVVLTDEVLAPAVDFRIDLPRGFAAAGTTGGAVQMYMRGTGEVLVCSRSERAVRPEELSRMGRQIFAKALPTYMSSSELKADRVAESRGWQLYENEFSGKSNTSGKQIGGLARMQTNAAGEGYMCLAMNDGPPTPEWLEEIRAAFESVTQAPAPAK